MRFAFDIPACCRYLIKLLEHSGYEAYVVGGCVRDSLIGRKPNDWDICTSARPETVCDILTRNHVRTIETGLKHGTVTACCGMYDYEITTFRVDGEYSDNRRPDTVEFVGDIVDDLARRDFTINAIAYADQGQYVGNLIDPWDGFRDLANQIIRCVRNPDDRFREDALRILRALRFASTYGFTIEEKTAAAIHRNRELLKNVSAERIQSELCKLLCGKGVLDILLEYKDVLAVIIPEFLPCIGFEQNNPYHKYDVYDHMAHAVSNYRGNDISVKMALLLHDIGKPECYTEDENGGHFHGHSVPSAYLAQGVLQRLRFDNKTTDEVIKLVLYHDSDIQPHPKAVRRWLNKIGEDTLSNLLHVRMADINAHSERNQISKLDKYSMVREIMEEIIANQQCFTIKDLAVNGNDIIALGVETGPRIGEVLNHLLNMVLDEEIQNEHYGLITEAKRYLEETK